MTPILLPLLEVICSREISGSRWHYPERALCFSSAPRGPTRKISSQQSPSKSCTFYHQLCDIAAFRRGVDEVLDVLSRADRLSRNVGRTANTWCVTPRKIVELVIQLPHQPSSLLGEGFLQRHNILPKLNKAIRLLVKEVSCVGN